MRDDILAMQTGQALSYGNAGKGYFSVASVIDAVFAGGDLNFSPIGQEGYSLPRDDPRLAEDARRLSLLAFLGLAINESDP
eukprot:gene39571-31833_t